jgi:hypothetical protein
MDLLLVVEAEVLLKVVCLVVEMLDMMVVQDMVINLLVELVGL